MPQRLLDGVESNRDTWLTCVAIGVCWTGLGWIAVSFHGTVTGTAEQISRVHPGVPGCVVISFVFNRNFVLDLGAPLGASNAFPVVMKPFEIGRPGMIAGPLGRTLADSEGGEESEPLEEEYEYALGDLQSSEVPVHPEESLTGVQKRSIVVLYYRVYPSLVPIDNRYSC
ncbi:hypothetical protein B0H10DRAFT_1956525 [Mycena sp. CBHHK59/15]|nr:hypothetical protein B0H10DRAFT_1956525 [Mycena sp. CBHHK59/15]